MSNHKAILEFNLQDFDAKDEFNCAIKGKSYWIALYNLREELRKVYNNKNYDIEGRVNLIETSLKSCGLNETQIENIINMIDELKNSICESCFEIIDSQDIDNING